MNTPEMTTIAKPAKIRSSKFMSIWDAPIGLANIVYTWAYITLVFGAILTAISTMSLFWASGVRDKFSDVQISTARNDAAQAKTEQIRLKIELEKEQIERLKFEAQFSWRTVSKSATGTLIKSLSKNPGNINIGFVASDPEATSLADTLRIIFLTANWNVRMTANSYPGTVLFGIYLPDSANSQAIGEVRTSFQLAEIDFSTQTPPTPTMFFGDGTSPAKGSIDLIIGSKSLPGFQNTATQTGGS